VRERERERGREGETEIREGATDRMKNQAEPSRSFGRSKAAV